MLRVSQVRFSASALALVALGAGTTALPGPLAAADSTLYSTDFDSFYPTGDDTLVGEGGWLGTNQGEGLHGVDSIDGTGLLGQSAYLGGSPAGRTPSSPLVIVWRPVDHDPLAMGAPVVEVFATVGVSDGGTLPRDNFYFSIYNGSGAVLAAINFDNTTAGTGPLHLYRWNGSGAPLDSLGAVFERNLSQELFLSIDFESNRWSALLLDQDPFDGVDTTIPLFEDAVFNGSGAALDLGSLAFEWEISTQIADSIIPGSNYLLFDNIEVTASGESAVEAPPFAVASVSYDAGGGATLRWSGEAGSTDRVEYSGDMKSWLADLPGAEITAAADGEALEFTDATAPGTAGEPRFYRVVRAASSPSP